MNSIVVLVTVNSPPNNSRISRLEPFLRSEFSFGLASQFFWNLSGLPSGGAVFSPSRGPLEDERDASTKCQVNHRLRVSPMVDRLRVSPMVDWGIHGQRRLVLGHQAAMVCRFCPSFDPSETTRSMIVNQPHDPTSPALYNADAWNPRLEAS